MKHFPVYRARAPEHNRELNRLSQVRTAMSHERAKLNRAADDFEKRSAQNRLRQLQSEYRELAAFADKFVAALPAMAAAEVQQKLAADPEFQEVEALMAAAVERIDMALHLDSDPPRVARAAWFNADRFREALADG